MRISYSSFDTYKQCPLKYKYREIDKIKEPKSKEQVFGTIMHATMKFIHAPGLLQPTVEEALDYFSRSWNSDIFAEETEERAAFAQGVDMIQKYYRAHGDETPDVIDLESRFAIDIGPENNRHVVAGIIDRIDKTEDGYEIIDYKTGRSMPSQEKVDADMQLSIYLRAFLARYPKEAANVKNLTVSLYFLKHGVKLSSTRTKEQLETVEETLLDTIADIHKGEFPPRVSPLCDWCAFQKICPMWRHKFSGTQKVDAKQAHESVEEYMQLKADMQSGRKRLAQLQEKIMQYMEEEGVEQMFGDHGSVLRTQKKSYAWDEEKLRAVLKPLGVWDDVVKVSGTAVSKVLRSLPSSVEKQVHAARIVDKETAALTVKKA